MDSMKEKPYGLLIVDDDPDVLLAPDNRIDIPTLEADVDVPVIGVKRGDVNHSAALGCQ